MYGNISFVNDRVGNSCSAVKFNGNSFIELPHDDVFNTISNEFTLSTWVKLTSDKSKDNWLTLLCKGDNSVEANNNPHFRVQLFQSTNNRQSTVSINTEFTEYDNKFYFHVFPQNKWFFFALVYNGKEVSYFINGKKVWSYEYTGNLVANKSSIYIGKDIPGNLEFFKGQLDDFKLYDYSLSDSEINNEYKKMKLINNTFNFECNKDTVVFVDKLDDKKVVNYHDYYKSTCGVIKSKRLEGLPSGSEFSIGENRVVLSFEHGGNNMDICDFLIYVKDTISPVFSDVKDTTLIVQNKKFNIKAFKPFATDNDKIAKVEFYKTDSIFSVLGEKNIVCKATDKSGNFTFCAYKLNIVYNDIDSIAKTSTDLIVKNNTVKKALPVNIVYKEEFEFHTEYITFYAYDNKKEDGDIISIFIDDKEIIHRQTLKSKKHGAIIKVLKFKANEEHDFVIKAWNTGSVGKNTVRVDFYEGDVSKNKINTLQPNYNIVLQSHPGLSPAIKLKIK